MSNQPDTTGITPETPALEITGLTKHFGNFTALRDIDLAVRKGEFICFLGPSGCGKTTLLRAIAGLDPQDKGSIRQNGRDISHLPVSGRDFGIVFQSYALFPNLSVSRNIGYGLKRSDMSRADRKARIDELLAMVGLGDQGAKFPAQLSGGQQQRVALARALAPSPGLLLLDEPLSALDAQVRLRLRDELRDLQRRLGVTTIMVTHDQDEALATADRIVVMSNGHIEQIGTPEEVFSRPETPFVARFFGRMNFIPGRMTNPTTARIGEVEMQLPGHVSVAHDPIDLCIRPADVTLGAKDPTHAGNQLKARIDSIAFRGNFHQISAYCAAIEQNLDVEVPARDWASVNLAEGAETTLHLPPARLHVFARPACAGPD